MKSRKNFIVFLFFLVLSTLLWFLDALNQSYKTTVAVPVTYINWPNGKMNISDLPDKLEVTVTGYGFDILNYNLKSSLRKVKIDLGQADLTPMGKNDSVHYYLLSKSIVDQVNAQLVQGLKALSIKPDTIFFAFTSLGTKIVPVKLDAQFKFAKQFTAKSEPKLTPEQVSVTAPLVILDTLKFIKTKEYFFNNIKESIDQELLLKAPPKSTVKPSKVKLTLEVERYTEVRKKINLQVINQPDSIVLRIFPQAVTVKYLVGFSNYQKVNTADFIFAVDYNDIKKSISGRLPVKVLHAPTNIISYTYSPTSVDYIIETKND